MHQISNEIQVTVLMAIYNEPLDYIKKAIDSTLNSCDKFKFEFILIIDNPALETSISDYLKTLDSSFYIIYNSENLGLALSLNKGIDKAKGKYIMRMDADDVCVNERVKIQYDFMEHNSHVDLIGGGLIRIDEFGHEIGVSNSVNGVFNSITGCAEIKNKSICYHPTWFVKTQVLKTFKYHNLPCSQDLELLFRMLDSGVVISNVKKNILYYRVNSNSLSFKKGYEQTLIRLSLNKIYTKGCSFALLEKNISLLKERNISRKIFLITHEKYIKALNDKHYLMVILCSLLSPLHFSKSLLLFKSKLQKYAK